MLLKLVCFFVLTVLSSSIKNQRYTPPPPFNEAYQITILTGGIVYGIPDSNHRITKHAYKPQRVDVVIAAHKILSLIDPSKTAALINATESLGLKVLQIAVQNQLIVPGLIDAHVHTIGGGGEQGPFSRTPESRLSQLVNGGLTTVVGILGTDGVSRSLSALLQKMKGLERDGLSTWMWVGSYRIPIVTLTGSLQQDLLLIDKVIGAGELALSDHRSSWPSKSELLQLISDARIGGMLSGKAGVIHFHMGSAPTKIELLWQILNETTIPIRHMYLTHMTSRGEALIEEARKWILAGGVCDFSADAVQYNYTTTVETLNEFRQKKLPLEQITVTSDAYGSYPEYNASGTLIAYGMSSPDLTLKTIQNLVLKYSWPLEEAIQFSTANPAKYLHFQQKGFIAENLDADLLILNQTDLSPLFVIGRGQILKTPTWVKHDMFEPLNQPL